TPVAKPSESVPADNSSAVTPTPKDSVASSTNDDTNIGGASEVIKSIDSGANTPATQPAPEAPVEAQKPVVETPKTDTPATSGQFNGHNSGISGDDKDGYNANVDGEGASVPTGSSVTELPDKGASSSQSDTNIGGASEVITDQTGVSSPAASSTPVAKPSESVPADNSSAVTPTPKDSVASSTNDDTN
ncbi:hypothetical protein J3326_10490, partial [Leuconostoc mesenteroides]|uniref:hypothetical protein n=1 Tax=Leuconostoc mesenteroides TaxID=1245 RepID=UPI001CC0BA61